MASKYKTIKGKRYDRSLIEKADELQESKKGASLGQNEVKALWQLAQDGQKVTDTEKQTLDYIVNNYTISTKAGQWLQEQIQGLGQENATEAEGKSPQSKARGKQSSQQQGKTTGQAPKTQKTSRKKNLQSVDQPSGAEPPPSQEQQSQTSEEQQPSSPPPEDPPRESMSEQPAVQPSTDQPSRGQENTKQNSWLKWLVAAVIVVAIVFVFWPKSSSEDADQIHHQAKHQPEGTAPKDKSHQNKTDKKTDKKPATKNQKKQKAKAESKDSTKQNKPQKKKTTPKTPKEPTKAKTDSGPKNQNTITVQKGDTLRDIAQREYGDADAWEKIYQTNSSKIKDPNRIFAGQNLTIPAQ